MEKRTREECICLSTLETSPFCSATRDAQEPANDCMLVILVITCFFSWFPLVFHGVTIAELDTGFNLEATDEANEFVERLVHVHPVLGRALDERGLQLLRHVFTVRCRHLKAISKSYSMQRIFGLSMTLIGIFF